MVGNSLSEPEDGILQSSIGGRGKMFSGGYGGWHVFGEEGESLWLE